MGWVVVPAILLRACVWENMRVSDETMLAAKPGDLLWVAKLSYGLRIPGIGTYMTNWQQVREGDLVVLTDVGEPPQTLLRKIAGVPRQKVQLPGQKDEWQLKSDEYLVIADNADKAPDSRTFGTVSRRNIVGKAKYVWRAQQSRVESLQ